MKVIKLSRSGIKSAGSEGILFVISVTPLIFFPDNPQESLLSFMRSGASVLSFLFCLICAAFLYRHHIIAKLAGTLSLALFILSGYHFFSADPFNALCGSLIFIYLFFRIYHLKNVLSYIKSSTHKQRSLQRSLWGSAAFVFIFLLSVLYLNPDSFTFTAIIFLSALINQVIFFQFIKAVKKEMKHSFYFYLGLSFFLIIFFIPFYKYAGLIYFLTVIITVFIIPKSKIFYSKTKWLEVILDNPGSILISGFLFLCFTGTILLILPFSSADKIISITDAAFTSVSAVCVTGLIVLDTPNDFSFTGQCFILGLIQLGGLGIMIIATTGFHAMGKRLSLKQEKIISDATSIESRDLVKSLLFILKFTFSAEAMGALILTAGFIYSGDDFFSGLFRGIFTAVSAFCNAGFALQTDSLMQYSQNPVIIFTVAALILAGGLAPATSIMIPDFVVGNKIPTASFIPIITTIFLIVTGFISILIFEWNGFLSEFSTLYKLQNAFFQSVTLRTAGFNSVDFSVLSDPVFLFMILLMFIGGSPGSTAGGIKTTTFAILILTFWTTVKNKTDIIVQSRKIPQNIVNRAVTIAFSGAVTWVIVILMLETTQNINVSDIVFEAVSALSTVGLSTGATAMLDGIGKIIIIVAMFAGRIGPMTLFIFLINENKNLFSQSEYPESRITLN
jgi:trk system potassium uptake protein TrkH